jgi:anti-sigma regulatory factor (Ser/Thr protein kinase)
MSKNICAPTAEKPVRFEIETTADLDHLEEINAFIEESLGKLGISGEHYGHICVSLDEAVTNVIMYAYPDLKGNVKIIIAKVNDRVSIEVIDSGAPFNPLGHPVPDVSLKIENRIIGGLGIHLMRNMMDELTYRRDGDKNCLSLVKHIGEKND